ncbi:MAG: NADH-quinone oxidoreductase subunit I [Elusimicrobia bacterium]|nr:NADH-quinone oxidoreductase subunit I [Elusimicrobiota bacterium]
MPVSVRPVARPSRGLWEQVYILEVVRGLGVTFRHFFVNLWRHGLKLAGRATEPGAVTIQYPDDPAVLGRRARTRHRLLRRADGSPRCTSCLLCETICPAKCIHITAEESPDPGVEKRARSFDIDIGMCVFCGHCVEACPVDAIRMDADRVELAAYSRTALIWDIESLMQEPR